MSDSDSGKPPLDGEKLQSDFAPEKLRQFGFVQLNNSTFHGMTNVLSSQNLCATGFWLTTILTALLVQLVHMFFLLNSAVNSNTVTNIKYSPIQQVPLAKLTLCGHPSKLLDSDKLSEANLHLSVALRLLSLYGLMEPSILHLSEAEEAQLDQKAFELNQKLFSSDTTSTNSEKIRKFLLNFTIDCDKLISGCSQGYAGAGKKFECCEVFSPVMTAGGICFAFNSAMWNKSRSAGVFSGLSAHLNHSKLRLDDKLYEKNFGPSALSDLTISVSNGIEQNPLANNFVTIKAGEDVQVTVTSTKLEFLPGKGACVTDTELDFYKDYTTNNCVWERSFYKSPRTPNCSIAFDLTKLGFNFIGAAGKRKVTSADGSVFTECHPDYMRSFYLNSTHDYSRWVSIIDVPNRPDNCPFPCDYWEMSMSVMKNANSYDVRYPLSLVKITQINQNPLVAELVAIEWKDYLCLAGGAMGLWTGSSVITIIQCGIGGLTILMAFLWQSCRGLTNWHNWQRHRVADSTNVQTVHFINTSGQN